MNAVSFENKISIYVLLEIGHLSMTKWCPLTEIETDFFFCDANKTHKISAGYLCDGKVHCPLTKADESPSLCNPWKIRSIAVSPFLINILLAICCAAYLARQQEKHRIKELESRYSKEYRQVIPVLKLVTKNAWTPSPENEKGEPSFLTHLKQ